MSTTLAILDGSSDKCGLSPSAKLPKPLLSILCLGLLGVRKRAPSARPVVGVLKESVAESVVLADEARGGSGGGPGMWSGGGSLISTSWRNSAVFLEMKLERLSRVVVSDSEIWLRRWWRSWTGVGVARARRRDLRSW